MDPSCSTAASPCWLTGVGFPPQVLIGTDSITNLHKLEQVSSDEGIGTLAENLLEALREHPEVNKKIDAARRETRAEKKRMAMAMRQKALGTLGMTVRAGGDLLPPGRWLAGKACFGHERTLRVGWGGARQPSQGKGARIRAAVEPGPPSSREEFPEGLQEMFSSLPTWPVVGLFFFRPTRKAKW